jgi:hypothetical protein
VSRKAVKVKNMSKRKDHVTDELEKLDLELLKKSEEALKDYKQNPQPHADDAIMEQIQDLHDDALNSLLRG